MLNRILIFVILANLVVAARLFGRFENVPQEALDAARSGLKSHIVNGLNFQSRIDISLVEVGKIKLAETRVFPVAKDYSFQTPDLPTGEYELSIHSYDFSVRTPRYRILVNDQIEAYEDPLASDSYNTSSIQLLTIETPLLVELSGFKSYYESPEGKLTEMVMNSPLGVVFRSKLYTALFFGMLVIMVFPYIIPYVAPDFAEQFQQLQTEMSQPPRPAEKIEEIPAEKAAVRQSRAKQRR